MTPFAKSIGLSAPRFAKSFIRPGWLTDARSGGLPPATAVASTVGVWSPDDVYLTLTSGFAFVNPSMTAWKFCSSAPVHTPVIEMLPETPLCLVFAPAVLVATSAATASAVSATSAVSFLILILLLSRRRPQDPCPGRRNAVRACRRLLPSARPPSHASVPRNGRR